MGRMGSSRKTYSASPADYKLLEEVGYGASATVYRAIYLPLNEVIAVKCLDLDRCNSNLDDIRKEAQTMSLIDHSNVIRAYCSFVVDQCLWVVMPFMAEGSCLHLMKIAYPDGFEESVIGSILKETLKALEYLHRHGHIHRDVKAGNILLDSNGVVKLGDFGVSACMFDKGDRQRSRNTFVGTPCWMAPEVLQPGSGYDFKADIWSFGITSLELAHGHAPFSKYPPMKVLLMTIQNAPPGLDYDRDKKFSKSFKEMVAMCLVKDQTKRPTAEKLLKHSFFKNAKPPELSVKSLLAGLPPLWDRVKALQLKDAAQLALKKMPTAEQEAISQSEYKRGVSAWNFDIEDLKAQASLVQDDDDLMGMKEEDENMRLSVNDKDSSVYGSSLGKSISTNDINGRGNSSGADWSEARCLIGKGEILETELADSINQEKFDRQKKDGSSNGPMSSTSERDMGQACPKTQVGKTYQTQSGPLVPSSVLSHSLSERERIPERCESDNQPAAEKYKRNPRKAPSFSGPLMLPTRASLNSLSAPIRSSGGFRDSLEDKPKANVVQVKGRFSVTSETVELAKVSPLRKSASVGDWLVDSRQVPNCLSPKEVSNSAIPASILVPHLQNLFHQTALQQDLIVNLLNSLQQTEIVDGFQTEKLTRQTRNSENDTSTESTSSERERLLLIKISELQARMANLTDELSAAKQKHIQLQQQLNAAYCREEDKSRREKDN
ncbi:serine/threonine-protein kinase BLUS1-like isoform X2 [Magnolia sinica]|uniref:serine/threonine-protein kinase BLUS1-like isoform X2 n=1 Tax=Magnolia sinica TaxID=86752 RepID=UPI002659FFF6|nr:serine/threonine-protein kinase BLUS1-like isoform X2 [Magnolia sinica]